MGLFGAAPLGNRVYGKGRTIVELALRTSENIKRQAALFDLKNELEQLGEGIRATLNRALL
ncbi:hypothetical protein KFU94_58085 [Chloroflexi bacterium TSY]|nr:hypothetical protein [Chloroflexi bacterium TSY]